MISRKDLALAFATFRAAGCFTPKDHQTEAGLDLALRIWGAALSDLEPEELGALAIAWIRSPKARHWPTPGELLALRNDAPDDALTRWGSLRRLIGKHGMYAEAPTPIGLVGERSNAWALDADPAVDEAMRAGLEAIGGWRAACLMQDRDTTANRAAFRDAYRASIAASRARADRAVARQIATANAPRLEDSGNE